MWIENVLHTDSERGASSQDLCEFFFHSYLQILRLLTGMQQYEKLFNSLEKSCSHRTIIYM